MGGSAVKGAANSSDEETENGRPLAVARKSMAARAEEDRTDIGAALMALSPNTKQRGSGGGEMPMAGAMALDRHRRTRIPQSSSSPLMSPGGPSALSRSPPEPLPSADRLSFSSSKRPAQDLAARLAPLARPGSGGSNEEVGLPPRASASASSRHLDSPGSTASYASSGDRDVHSSGRKRTSATDRPPPSGTRSLGALVGDGTVPLRSVTTRRPGVSGSADRLSPLAGRTLLQPSGEPLRPGSSGSNNSGRSTPTPSARSLISSSTIDATEACPSQTTLGSTGDNPLATTGQRFRTTGTFSPGASGRVGARTVAADADDDMQGLGGADLASSSSRQRLERSPATKSLGFNTTSTAAAATSVHHGSSVNVQNVTSFSAAAGAAAATSVYPGGSIKQHNSSLGSGHSGGHSGHVAGVSTSGSWATPAGKPPSRTSQQPPLAPGTGTRPLESPAAGSRPMKSSASAGTLSFTLNLSALAADDQDVPFVAPVASSEKHHRKRSRSDSRHKKRSSKDKDAKVSVDGDPFGSRRAHDSGSGGGGESTDVVPVRREKNGLVSEVDERRSSSTGGARDARGSEHRRHGSGGDAGAAQKGSDGAQRADSVGEAVLKTAAIVTTGAHAGAEAVAAPAAAAAAKAAAATSTATAAAAAEIFA
eukprot:TRINITY_DN7579_c0_g5_i1.p1 TRINITY_DN7579_c0_g5~~TRINITY_DN7579_c0_g5_i1.p1  ORF type:complete len:651 (+),score=102.74 TRINITY_DN7579_c0_g5_i1:51-2003(+)